MSVQLLKVGTSVLVSPREGFPLRFQPYRATITDIAARGGITGIRDDRCKYTPETYRREVRPYVGCGKGCNHMTHIGSMYVTAG